MGVRVEITCDACGKKLNRETESPHIYTLQLRCLDRRVRSRQGGITNAVLMHPPLDNDLEFCGWGCLTVWLRNNGRIPE